MDFKTFHQPLLLLHPLKLGMQEQDNLPPTLINHTFLKKKKTSIINYNMFSFKRRLQNIQVICYEVCKCPVLVMFGYQFILNLAFIVFFGQFLGHFLHFFSFFTKKFVIFFVIFLVTVEWTAQFHHFWFWLRMACNLL